MDTLRFWATFGGLGTTYDDHLGLIGKRVVDCLFMLIEVHSLCVTAEARRAKRSKIGDFAPTRSLWSKISGRKGRPPPIIFARLVRTIVRPMNALQFCRWQFLHKETLQQTFFKRSAIFYGNRPFCVFRTPLGDLGATYDDHRRLIGKRVVDFLLVLIELFSLGATAEVLRANIGWKSAILLQRGPVDPKFR